MGPFSEIAVGWQDTEDSGRVGSEKFATVGSRVSVRVEWP